MIRERMIRLGGQLSRWLIPLAAIAILAAFLFVTPPGLLGKADGVGYAVCHRIDERSFHLDGRQLPLCARCTGEFNAAAITLAYLAVTARKRSQMARRGVLAMLAALFLAFAVDGANSYLYLLKETYPGSFTALPNLYTPNNALRLFTGSGMGLAMAAILYPVVNQTIWREVDDRPVMGWREFLGLVGIIILVNLGIRSEQAVVLYPVALLSVLGVVALLSLVFSMVWVIIMRQENAFDSVSQLWMPALAGLTLALLMVMVIDLLRLRLTGTWGGFPLG